MPAFVLTAGECLFEVKQEVRILLLDETLKATIRLSEPSVTIYSLQYIWNMFSACSGTPLSSLFKMEKNMTQPRLCSEVSKEGSGVETKRPSETLTKLDRVAANRWEAVYRTTIAKTLHKTGLYERVTRGRLSKHLEKGTLVQWDQNGTFWPWQKNAMFGGNPRLLVPLRTPSLV